MSTIHEVYLILRSDAGGFEVHRQAAGVSTVIYDEPIGRAPTLEAARALLKEEAPAGIELQPGRPKGRIVEYWMEPIE